MDRDIVLILIGAGIGFVSNLLMRLIEFILRIIAAKLYLHLESRRTQKFWRKKLLGEDVNLEERSFWSEILLDIAKLRHGGGKKPGLDSPVDYVFLTIQWLVTVGAVLYWIFIAMPKLH